MRRNKDKVLVIITAAIFIVTFLIIYFLDIICPKKIDQNFGLKFGDSTAAINVVVFEDFKCKHCKQLSNNFFPYIKQNYLDTEKINYTIVPVAFICGSKAIANAAIAIYELNKNEFFNFLHKISDENIKIESKQDLVILAKQLEGINIEIFEELLNKEVFNEYLEENLTYAQKLMRRKFEVPTIYVNGYKVSMNKFSKTVNELISRIQKNEIY